MIWREFFSLFRPPVFDWIQVEVTTHCNAACTYCPHTVYRNSWASRHLPLQAFKKLIPAFSRTRMVHLQGWGEPFLNPDSFAMAKLARQAGCRVGVTTNGTLLERERIIRVVESELDVVAFSLAGADETQDGVRRGASFNRTIKAIRGFQEEKARRGRQKPHIHLAYMLLRTGLADLPRLPRLAKDLDVRQVVINALDFVPALELEGQALRLGSPEEYREVLSLLDDAVQTGAAHGQDIRYYLPSPDGGRGRTCRENVQRALVVGAGGQVAPCVYANLPVSGVAYAAQGREFPYQPINFGNIEETPLAEIWGRPNYASFRHSFQEGPLAALCSTCSKR
jgi:MoaA/NifB/PqqE/SkfB family radical SAM enzyme